MTDRERFQAAAIATLRQEVPEDLEWIPWREIPPQLWREDAAPVDERIPRGWLVGSALRGEPEPDRETRDHAALLMPEDANALGGWLLRAWIAHDTEEPALSGARKTELRGIAERAAALAKRFGRGGTDADQRYRELLAQEGNRAPASALPHQGLLAVVAACAGTGAEVEAEADLIADLVAAVERYLMARYAERPAQSRALVRMLAWIEAPAAAELLAAVSRLPELREAAAAAIAARQARAEGA